MLVTGVIGVWLGLQIAGARVTLWVDDLVTPLVASVACVSCLGARARHDGRMRLFWSLLACATASWTLAEVVWGYYALILNVEVPVPSWADVGYLAAIPLAVAALVVHPATRGSGTRKVRSLFDSLVVATSLLLLSWTLVLGPLARSADLSTSTGVVTLAYPFGDVVIVFFMVLAIRGMTGSNRLSLGSNSLSLCCLLAALLAMALSDSIFSYLTEVAKYTGGDVIDTGWVAAYLGIALAAFSSRASDTTVSPAEQLEAIAGVARNPAVAGAARVERLCCGDQARPSPRPRRLADDGRADRAGVHAPGADGARAARAQPKRPSRPDAQAYACGFGGQTPRGDTVTRPPDWWL